MKKEINAFLTGFHQVIPVSHISIFDADELDFMMSGVPEINLEDWKSNTVYRGELNVNHSLVKWFWEILGTLT